MANEGADDQTLAELRRESEALRQIPAAKRAQAAKPRHPEYRALIAKAVASESPFEEVGRELGAFPPGVVGHAVSTVWESVSGEKRAQIIQRLRGLDTERHVGEGVPLGMQLLRAPSSAPAGADVLSGFPASEKTVQRLASDLFGSDGIPMQHLVAPADTGTAVALWRVLFKAAVHEKAQSWRRFQLLKLVLGWLAENERFKAPQHRDLITQCRELSQRLDSTAASSLREELQRQEVWREILGQDAAVGTAAKPAALPRLAEPPPTDPVTASSVLAPTGERQTAKAPGLRAPEPPSEPEVTVEEARDTLLQLRDRHAREMRAIDRLLTTVRVADARFAQIEREAKDAREQLRRRQIELDEVKESLERARTAASTNESRREAAVQEANELRNRVAGLQADLANQADQIAALRTTGERDRAAWEEQKRQLEGQVFESASIKLDEFKQRVGRRVDQITRDLHPRKASMDGNTAAAVLNTRLHEVLDLLAEGGVPIRARD